MKQEPLKPTLSKAGMSRQNVPKARWGECLRGHRCSCRCRCRCRHSSCCHHTQTAPLPAHGDASHAASASCKKYTSRTHFTPDLWTAAAFTLAIPPMPAMPSTCGMHGIALHACTAMPFMGESLRRTWQFTGQRCIDGCFSPTTLSPLAQLPMPRQASIHFAMCLGTTCR